MVLFLFGIVLLVLPAGPHTWRLPVPGHVASLVPDTSWEAQEVVAEGVGRRVRWVSGSGPNRRRIRLNRKTPAHLAGLVIQSRSRVWKRLSHASIFLISFLIARGRGMIRMMGDMLLLSAGLEWDNSWVSCGAHVSSSVHV